MKIKKLTPEQVSDKKLDYKVYRKVLKPALKAMIGEHNSAETTTEFIIKTNFEFVDMKGKKMGFIIPGEQTSAWLKLTKEEIKNDKKNTCLGTCYVKKNADGSYVLVLLPEKGAAKKNLMKKQLEKFALKGMPFTIEIAAGGELEDDSAEEVVVDDVDLPEESEEDANEEEDDEVEAVDVEPTKTPPTAQELLATHKTLVEQFKTVRDEAHDSNSLKALFKQVARWQKYYNLLEEEPKQKLAAHAEQVQKMMDATHQMIKADHVLENDIDSVVEFIAQFVDNPSEDLSNQILSTLKNVEKIAKSLGAAGILEQVDELKTLLA